MEDLWQADPRLVRTIEAPSSRQYTVSLDGLAHGLAQEAEWFLSTLPLDDAAAEWLRDELRVATKALRRSAGQRLPPVTPAEQAGGWPRLAAQWTTTPRLAVGVGGASHAR
jgi:hypothetical protein